MKKYYLIGGSITLIVFLNISYACHEMIVFVYDSGYHMLEGISTSLILAFFYKKFI
jgi:hypothetical protein